MPDAKIITEAIIHVESRGNCDAKGASGENGCMQFMPSTWAAYSKQVLGYVADMTPTNEKYVALIKITEWMRDGHDMDNVARIWNQGNAGPCGSGVNSKGVPYDSCAHEAAVLAAVDKIKLYN